MAEKDETMKLRERHGSRLRVVACAGWLATALSMTTLPCFAQEPTTTEPDQPSQPAPETDADAPPALPAPAPPTPSTPQTAPPVLVPAEPGVPAAAAPTRPEAPACDERAIAASVEQHHRHTGFHVNGELGLAFMDARASSQGSTIESAGVSTVASLRVGGAVVENLIIAGELWTMRAPSSKWRVDGAAVTPRSDVSATLSGIGVNLTYYLMPANVFFSVTPSVGILALENTDERTGVRTKTGFSGRVAIGKEWWVARQFGIGVAANGFLGINGDEGETATARSTFYWTTLGAGASFTGSYN